MVNQDKKLKNAKNLRSYTFFFVITWVIIQSYKTWITVQVYKMLNVIKCSQLVPHYYSLITKIILLIISFLYNTENRTEWNVFGYIKKRMIITVFIRINYKKKLKTSSLTESIYPRFNFIFLKFF